MNYLASTNLKAISSVLRATTNGISRPFVPCFHRYIFCGNDFYLNSTSGSLLSPLIPKINTILLREYATAAAASSARQRSEMFKKEIVALLGNNESDAEPKMHTTQIPASEIDKASSLVPRYLVSIAVDPYVQHESILEIFRLYAMSMRPIAQDKIDFPKEFTFLVTATEHALQLMSLPELHLMAQYLNDLQSQQLALVMRLIKTLCQECSARLHLKPSFMEAIKLYELAIFMYPRALPQSYHEIFNEFFVHNMDGASLKEKVKLMYFFSLNPMSMFSHLIEELSESVYPHVSSMPLKMQGIVASSVLKCNSIEKLANVPFLPDLVPNLLSFLCSENKGMDELESFAIRSEIDLMRLARFQNEDLTSALESFILGYGDGNGLTLNTMQCFLAYVCTQCYSQDVFEKIEEQLMNILQDETRQPLVLSDLARILWAMSTVSHKCSSSLIKEVIRELHVQLTLDHLHRNFLKFVDALISLAMMGHVDVELCQLAFLPPKGKACYYRGHQEMKLVTRISTLRECLSIERPDIILSQDVTRTVASANPEHTMLQHDRPLVYSLHRDLEKMLAHSSSPGVRLSLQGPLRTVKLAGVCLQLDNDNAGQTDDSIGAVSSAGSTSNKTFESSLDTLSINSSAVHDCSRATSLLAECLVRLQRPVSIEVLDKTNMIKENNGGYRLNGALAYKLRLMDQIGWKCILIRGDQIENCNDVVSLVVNEMQRCL